MPRRFSAFGLLGLTAATTEVGQLNYDDKFDGGPNTGRYRPSHAVLAYSAAGLFALGYVTLAAVTAGFCVLVL